MILTEQEIDVCQRAGNLDAICRAIEAAVLAKLCTGVGMPEPDSWRLYCERTAASIFHVRKLPANVDPAWEIRQLFTADQLRAYGAAARVQALEDVIRLCDPDALGLEQGDDCATGVYRVEKAIRALLGKEPT